jgi:probable F420-dependent oxidoreductase
MNRFRFAVQASAGAKSADEWSELANKAEELGFSTLFVPDHLDDGQLSPIVAMTAAAMSTTTLKVGSLVFNNDYRHPVLLAREMATLDVLSGGRLEVGIGAGWKRTDYDQTGIEYDKPGARIARLGESIEIITSLLKNGTSSFSGSYYSTKGAVGLPTPVSPGGPTLIIGGGGRKILSLAARYADIVGINPSLAAGEIGEDLINSVSPERFDERVAWVREAAQDRFESIELQCLTFIVSVVEDRHSWLNQVGPQFGLNAEQILEVPIVLVGTEDQIVATLIERRERFGLSYWVIHQHEMDDFAPVVRKLSGR